MKVLITAIPVLVTVQAVVLVVDLAAVPVNHDHQALMEISQGVKDLLSVTNLVARDLHLVISQPLVKDAHSVISLVAKDLLSVTNLVVKEPHLATSLVARDLHLVTNLLLVQNVLLVISLPSVTSLVARELHLVTNLLLVQNVPLAISLLLADHQAKDLADKENRALSQIGLQVIVLQIAHLVEILALEVTFQEKEAHAKNKS